MTVLQRARSLQQAAGWLRLDWDAVQRIMERAVERGLSRRSVEQVRHVGLDEKSPSAPSRFDKLPFDFAQGLSLSNGKAPSLPRGSWPNGFRRGQNYTASHHNL